MKAGNKKRTEDIFRNKSSTNNNALSKSAPVGNRKPGYTQTVGTITKRTGEKQPMRRTISGARADANSAPLPPMGITGGIGGIKMLRNTRK